jgi:hypothetical protein
MYTYTDNCHIAFTYTIYCNKNCYVHRSNDLSFLVNLSDKLQVLENKVIEKNIWT